MEPHERPTKRKRKTFSCWECRRRKLKCDRIQPSCRRCHEQGVECTYENPAGVQKQTPTDKNESTSEKRIETPASLHAIFTPPQAQYNTTHSTAPRNPTLEAPQSQGTWGLLGEQAASNSQARERPAIMSDSLHLLEPPVPRKQENVIFRGKNFKTQFYGGSNPTSLIGDFPELRSFMQDSIKQHPSLPRVQRELKSLQMKWKIEKKAAFPSVSVDLLDLFPEQEIADQLIQIYLETVETTYRIVHVSSFWKEYNSFLTDRSSARPAFLILLLLMMSTASSLSDERTAHVGDSAVSRERAALWIEISERWLRYQSQKQIYLTIWQIRCLLLLSKQVNVIKKKRIWTEAGTLLRQAMAAGFHRDPTILGEKVSIFDQEMRRRLWHTITELELQASIDRGMPSALAGVSSDCATVHNIDDADLPDENDSDFSSQDRDAYTNSSFLHLSKSSFSLRATLNTLVNNLGPPLQWEQVIEYEELVKEELESLPAWTKVVPRHDSNALSGAILQIQLQQFLILLHMPFARKCDSNPRCAVSRMVCLQSAQKILEQIQQLPRHGYAFVLLFRSEYFRAALAVCHSGYISYTTPGDLLGTNITSFIRYLDDTLEIFEDRIIRLGTDFTRYWYISAARSLLCSATNPSDETKQKQRAIELVARQYHRIRGSQEDLFSVKQQLKLREPSLPHDPNALAAIYDLPCDGNMLEPVDFPLESLEQEFFFGDPAAWTFENFEFL